MKTYGLPSLITFIHLGMAVIAYPYQRHAEKHIIDMNPETHPSLRYEALKIEVDIGEFMEIACPQYDLATPEKETFQFHLLDMHDGNSFESCSIQDKQVVLSCDTPFSPTKLTMKFQKMSPYPLGFTFQEGRSYYYIAIPVGEDDCKNAMRLVVNVQKQHINIPPIKPVIKEITPPTTTKSTTTTTTTMITPTPKSTVTPKRRQQTSTKGNSATHITRTIHLIALLAFIGSWINW